MKIKLLITLAAALFVSGCSSLSLDTRANRVVVSTHKPPIGCKYIAKIVATNDLKNQAIKLGGNYVQLVRTHGANSEVKVGKAYVCVPSRIGF